VRAAGARRDSEAVAVALTPTSLAWRS
jgi:hypothetical protein